MPERANRAQEQRYYDLGMLVAVIFNRAFDQIFPVFPGLIPQGDLQVYLKRLKISADINSPRAARRRQTCSGEFSIAPVPGGR